LILGFKNGYNNGTTHKMICMRGEMKRLIIAIVLLTVLTLNACGGEKTAREIDIPKPSDQVASGDVNTATPNEENALQNQNTDPQNQETPNTTTGGITDPTFPIATRATDWTMSRRTPDNMCLVDADITLPLGKVFDKQEPQKGEYRLVSFAAPQQNWIMGSPAVTKDRIYFGTSIGYFQCHNFTTSEPLFRNEEQLNTMRTAFAADKDMFFFGTADGLMYAYDLLADVQMWNFPTGKNISAPPGVTDEKYTMASIAGGPNIVGDRLYFGAFDGKLYCLNKKTGKKIWDFSTKGKIYSIPAISNGRVYFGNFEGKVFCLDEKTGKLIWEKSLPKSVLATPLVFGKRLWIGCKDNKMYCLDVNDGKTLWSYQCPSSKYALESCPGIDEKNIYFGDPEGYFYCIDRITGKEVWKKKISENIINSSPLIIRDKIFIGSFDYNLYALDKTTGKELDKFATHGSIYGSPIVIGDEIIVPDYDSNVYILRSKNKK